MATVTWVGAALTTPQVDTITIGSSTSTQTFTVTINGKTVTYTAVTSETTSTVATALAAALEASTEGEFSEIAWVASSATVVATGPADGRPFTLTVGGTGTISSSTTTTASSPNDANLGANYSTGSLPGNGDTLNLEGSSVSILWNLNALAAISTLAAVVRRATYTGTIGLPDYSSNGYREYRAKELATDAPVITWEAGADQAQQFRLKSTAGSAVTLTVAPAASTRGGGSSQVGGEALEIRGTPASSTAKIAGGSVAIAPYAGQTSTVATLLVTGGTVTLGSGVTLTNATFANSQGEVRCGYTTLTVSGRSAVTVAGAAAAATSTTADGGAITWTSTGGIGALTIEKEGGRLDLSSAPAAVSVGAITLTAGAELNDPYDRLTRTYAVTLTGCSIADVVFTTGDGRTFTVS